MTGKLIVAHRGASAKESGLAVMVWTVNDRQDIQRFLLNDLVCSIITNYPDVAVELKNKRE